MSSSSASSGFLELRQKNRNSIYNCNMCIMYNIILQHIRYKYCLVPRLCVICMGSVAFVCAKGVKLFYFVQCSIELWLKYRPFLKERITKPCKQLWRFWCTVSLFCHSINVDKFTTSLQRWSICLIELVKDHKLYFSQ